MLILGDGLCSGAFAINAQSQHSPASVWQHTPFPFSWPKAIVIIYPS